MKQGAVYSGENLREISMPIGGIGSGSIGLAGNGRLVDWEIANRPNKGGNNGHTFFAVKAEKNGACMDARVLQGDCPRDLMGQYTKATFTGYGYGPNSCTMAGFPHFEQCVFTGQFPVGQIDFAHPAFPGTVRLTAFNPFIPLNEDDSSLPAAFFTVTFCNNTDAEIDYTAAMTVSNWFAEGTRNEKIPGGVRLGQEKYAPEDKEYGELCLMTDALDYRVQTNWFRGKWFDGPTVFWKQFTQGPLPERTYEEAGKRDHATLCVQLHLKPGEEKSARFVLAWYFPNNYNYWNPIADDAGRDLTWKNWYAVLFGGAQHVCRYALEHFDTLYAKTEQFRAALWNASLPKAVVEAAADTLSVLKSPTVLRLQDGSIYGWEGVHELAGSCEGTCEHVWNYAYALCYLFPRLERSMRRLDYKYNLMENGGMRFRLTLPLGREGGWNMPCVDGQMGGVIKTYRDWKLSGDDAFLKELWPMLKKSLEFAWSPENPCRWDADKDGVLEGRQHHTLDMELFGPSSWLEGFYLAALKAGAEIAEYLGEPDSAKEYRALYEKGRSYLNETLFNGRYYDQQIDLTDKSILESYGDISTNNGGNVVQDYWNDEAGEIKYQIDHGCAIDQALAQWHANLCGLGDIFDREKLNIAVHSLYRENFVPRLREFFNPCRIFGLDGESGTVICAYPEDVTPPAIPVPYCQETMHGFEYAAAGLLIQNGMLKEGEIMVKAVRDRYAGHNRNPFNEMECGSNYARSMASYALIPIYSGFRCDMTRGHIGFAPLLPGDFSAPFALDSAWGEAAIKGKSLTLTIHAGSLHLQSLGVPFAPESVEVDGVPAAFALRDGEIVFAQPITAEKTIRVC